MVRVNELRELAYIARREAGRTTNPATAETLRGLAGAYERQAHEAERKRAASG